MLETIISILNVKGLFKALNNKYQILVLEYEDESFGKGYLVS